jgi:lysophospholipase L1-like esterase
MALSGGPPPPLRQPRRRPRYLSVAVTAGLTVTSVALLPGRTPTAMALVRRVPSASVLVTAGLHAADAAYPFTSGSATALAAARAPSGSGAVVAGPGSPAPAAPAPAPAPTPSAPSTPAPSASATPSGPLRVVGLGDSVPAGSACGCTSYVDLVGQQAASGAGRSADVDNLARSGYTTPDVLDQLQQPEAEGAVTTADLVIVTVGANDFDSGLVSDPSCDGPALDCYRSDLSQQGSHLAQVLSRIRALQAGRTGTILVTGYWNVFLDGEAGRAEGSAYVENSNALTLAVNRDIATAAGQAGATYVDIYTPFKGDGSRDDTALLADDGDHPDEAGHRLIARTLEAALP